MKQRFFSLLIAVLLTVIITGCSDRSVGESGSSTFPSESSAGTASRSDAFYPAEASYLGYDGSLVRGWSAWNPDGTFTFQNKNTLTTLSQDNQVLDTVTLLEDALPDSGYFLSRSDAYFLALANPSSPDTSYAALYFTDSGRVCLANLTLFDRQGNLIREYPRSEVYTYDEYDQMVYLLPCPEGETVADTYELSTSTFHWLDGHTAILDCQGWIVLYDFEADSGQILDDMSELLRQQGKYAVYYGSQMGGVLDGTYYYLTRRQEDVTSGYTLWAADADGTRELYDGQGFWHLFQSRNGLVLASDVDPADPESDSQVWYLGTGSPQLREIWTGNLSLPFTDTGRITFISWRRSEGSTVLYSYDPASDTLSSRDLGEDVQVDDLFTLERDGSLRHYYSQFKDGERTNWVYDTATDTTTSLTGFDGDLSAVQFNPDGSHWTEWDSSSPEPRLRISVWEF